MPRGCSEGRQGTVWFDLPRLGSKKLRCQSRHTTVWFDPPRLESKKLRLRRIARFDSQTAFGSSSRPVFIYVYIETCEKDRDDPSLRICHGYIRFPRQGRWHSFFALETEPGKWRFTLKSPVKSLPLCRCRH